MEWNQLQRFLVVAREENLSKAAEMLHTSQPSLSQVIKRLEEELGYPLFVREGKRIRLNESGKIFMQTAQQMEAMMEDTRLHLEELNSVPHPEVSIHFAAASQSMPKLLSYLKQRNPQISYRIYQHQDLDNASDADICIMTSPFVRGTIPEQLETSASQNDYVLFVEDTLLALPPNHPLQYKEQIFMSDLITEDFICMNEKWDIGREVMGELNRLCCVPKNIIIADNLNMQYDFIKEHLGVAVVISTKWYSSLGAELILRPIEDFQLSRYVYLHTKPRKYLSKEQKECINGIKEYFAKLKETYYHP